MCWSMTRQEGMGFLLKICSKIQNRKASRSISGCFCIFRRTFSCVLFEHFRKMINAVITNAASHLFDRLVITVKNRFCFFYAKIVQIFNRRNAVYRFKRLAKVHRAYSANFGKRRIGNIPIEMVFGYIFNCRI